MLLVAVIKRLSPPPPLFSSYAPFICSIKRVCGGIHYVTKPLVYKCAHFIQSPNSLLKTACALKKDGCGKLVAHSIFCYLLTKKRKLNIHFQSNLSRTMFKCQWLVEVCVCVCVCTRWRERCLRSLVKIGWYRSVCIIGQCHSLDWKTVNVVKTQQLTT